MGLFYTEFNDLFKDLNFENKLDKSGESELINDNTLSNVVKYVSDEKIKYEKDFNDKFDVLKDKASEVIISIGVIIKKLDELLRILYVCFYIYATSESIAPISSQTNVQTCVKKIIEQFFSSDDVNFYDFENLVNNHNVINKCDEKILFIRTSDFKTGIINYAN